MFVFSFDDGVTENYKPLLDILEYEKVKATFFIIGSTFTNSNNFILLKNAYDKGHTIGNHTWNHYKLNRLTTEQIEREVISTQSGLDLILPKNYPKYIRPPFGSMDKKAYDKLREMGYTVVRWNMDAKDWNKRRSKEQLLKYYEKTFKIANPLQTSFISLQHDRRIESIEIIPDIIRMARTKGFKIVSLDECLGINN
jgi:peptidoglycan/xylan/chitin deacetylase (PgdA/CDA1 family)